MGDVPRVGSGIASNLAAAADTIARLWLGFPGITLLAMACASDPWQHVSVEPAPAPGVVAFVLEDPHLMYGLTVMTCKGHAVWRISNADLGASPSRITYGIAPDGFVSQTGPKPLTPGCYDAIVSGPSRARFHIAVHGQLTAGTAAADSMEELRGARRAGRNSTGDYSP